MGLRRRKPDDAVGSLAKRIGAVDKHVRKQSRATEEIAHRLRALEHELAVERAVADGVDAEDVRDFVSALEMRRAALIEVHQPLVLIGQIPRSGGTLLMRLFDGHPELHAAPVEVHFRLPVEAKDVPADGAQAWDALAGSLEGQYVDHTGFSPSGTGRGERLPFLLPGRLHRRLFLELLARSENPGPRDATDAYFGALFNAWLDNRGLATGPKRWVTAFSPRRILSERIAQGFSAAPYPDGRLIAIVREPVSWWASARRWSDEWADRDDAIRFWEEFVRTLAERKAQLGDRIIVLRFEDLVGETEATMRRVADWLGIAFARELVTPTFNGLPVASNSSFGRVEGVDRAPLDRSGDSVGDRDAERIRAATKDSLALARELTTA